MWPSANDAIRSALIGLVLWAGCAQAQAPAPAAVPRAIWMWEDQSRAMLVDPQVAQDHMNFMRQQGIGTLYLYADRYQGEHLLWSSPQRAARLIERMHQQGFKVYALLGSWYLKTERYVLPEHRRTALDMFQRILDYNASVPEIARLDGINLDIEPHLLDEWPQQRDALLLGLVELSHAFMALKARAQLTLSVGAAIPFWWDQLPVRWQGRLKPTSEHLQDLYDYVTLMDYRDHAHGPDGILSHAQDELAYARRIGKKVQIGIETGPNDIRKVSFNHLTPADMARELGLVTQALDKDPAFDGFVIHHFGTYRRWLQERR